MRSKRPSKGADEAMHEQNGRMNTTMRATKGGGSLNVQRK